MIRCHERLRSGLDDSELFAMPDFRGLQVWQAAEDLTIHVYRVTRTMRGARGLSDQLLRAAMSVPINIVEGNAHSSPRERARFLGYAIASVWEVEGHVQLSLDLAMISTGEYRALLEEDRTHSENALKLHKKG